MGFSLFNREKSQEQLIKEQMNLQSKNEMINNLSVQQTAEDMALIERKDKLIELTQWQQSRSEAMQNIFNKLSGYYFDKTTATLKLNPNDTPFTTLVGAVKLVGFVETLDHNIMLGSWDTDRINLTLKHGIANPLKRFIYHNHSLLGIQDIYKADYILWLIVNCIEGNYMRGLNNGERKRDQEVRRINEVTTPLQENKKEGKLFGIKL